MHAEIVMIGTELLLGELVDTNANRLAKALRDIGLDLFYKTTVGDNRQRITDVLNLALDRSDIIITSGGIGPTVDDMTRQAVADATGRELVYSEELERQVADRFRSFGREMAENNKRQAWLPEGAAPLENPVGTAPCFLSEDVRGRGCVIVLPGVPRELQHMMDTTVIPLLIERIGGVQITRVRVLRTCAVGESNIDAAIGDLMTSSNPTVGLAAHSGQTDVRIAAKALEETEADALIADMEERLRDRLGVAVYGTGEQTVAGVVGALLEDRGLGLNVVDAMTDGGITDELSEAGYGECLKTHANPLSGPEVMSVVRSTGDSADPIRIAEETAESAGAENVVGLALVGPFDGGEIAIAARAPDGTSIAVPGRRFQASEHARRWLVIQGLDSVRRVLLGKLESPVDWNTRGS